MEPPPLPPPPAPPPAPADLGGEGGGGGVVRGLAKGLKDFDKALSNRSMCFLCHNKIDKGSLRFYYCLKPSASLKDARYCHVACAAEFPEGARAHDLRMVDKWLLENRENLEVYDVLQTVRDWLSGASSGSAASVG